MKFKRRFISSDDKNWPTHETKEFGTKTTDRSRETPGGQIK